MITKTATLPGAVVRDPASSLFQVFRQAIGLIVVALGLVILCYWSAVYIATLSDTLKATLHGGLMAAGATALGALPVIFMQRLHARTHSTLFGFSAGVMLAASFFSLLLPSFDAAMALNVSPVHAGLLLAGGVTAGALFLFAMDRSLPHSHRHGQAHSLAATWLFVFAVAMHNIPEGLAIGVAAGSAASGKAVATGVSLQNVPEGLIVAIALLGAGYRRRFAFLVAALSGFVEPLAAIAGSVTVSLSASLLPWGLAGAAGAMLFVVMHEIIPESCRLGHRGFACAGLTSGFVIMSVLDAWLT